MTFDDLFVELVAELRKGQVYERALRSDGPWQYHGLADDKTVHIDPRPAVLDILLHELLHRRYPRWGEARVDRTATRLVKSMDEAAKAKWWRAYNRIKRKARPVDVPEWDVK
jgi:hypothetical protein